MVKHQSIKHASVRCHHPFDDFYYHDFQFHTCDGIRIVRQSMRVYQVRYTSGHSLDRTVLVSEIHIVLAFHYNNIYLK